MVSAAGQHEFQVSGLLEIEIRREGMETEEVGKKEFYQLPGPGTPGSWWQVARLVGTNNLSWHTVLQQEFAVKSRVGARGDGDREGSICQEIAL